MKKLNLVGQVFGRLTVLESSPKLRKGTRWLCLCTCGQQKIANTQELRRGDTKSCGCLNVETIRTVSKVRNKKHGATINGKPTPEWLAWSALRGRCNNPNNPGYKNYGGRGITVAEAWLTYEQFIADMGPRPSKDHSIDRIDNNAGYSKENCRWATRTEQRNNVRTNRNLTMFDKTQSLAMWARELGIGEKAVIGLYKRLAQPGRPRRPSKNACNLTFGGKTQCASAWSRELGLGRKVLKRMAKQGIDPTIKPVGP